MCNLYFTHSIQLLDNTHAMKLKVQGGGGFSNAFSASFASLLQLLGTR
jgi:hypothetical protein